MARLMWSVLCEFGGNWLQFVTVILLKDYLRKLQWERTEPQMNQILWPDGKHIILLAEV